MIEVEGVWKSYDDLVAISDFRLRVAAGRTMGLIGPNGSGKTTLLKMLCTLAKPDCGTLRVGGYDCLSEPREVRRRISFMPAEFGVPLTMSIVEYMEYFACACGVPPRQRSARVRDVMDLTDLSGREEVLLRSLSTGNKQRVLLAKTLLADSPLLVLDEPASGLDPRARAEVRALLKELAGMGKTIVISSHILADLEDICSDICIIEKGRMVLSGGIEELRGGFKRPHKLVRLRLKEADLEPAKLLLGRLEGVLGVERDRAMLEVGSRDDNCNYILRALIENGVEILEMTEQRPDLEDIFMGSTKGVVS